VYGEAESVTAWCSHHHGVQLALLSDDSPGGRLLRATGLRGSLPLPLPPLAPVLGSEVQTFGIDAQVPLVHRPLVSLHDVLGESQDVLSLEERRHRTQRGMFKSGV